MDDLNKKKKVSVSNRHLRRICNAITVSELNDIECSLSENSTSYNFDISDKSNECNISNVLVKDMDTLDTLSTNIDSDNDSVDMNVDSEHSFIEDESFTEMFLRENPPSLKTNLRSWALEYNIPHNALSALLKLLKLHVQSDIPSDARTLLQTDRNTVISEVLPGKYCHFGLQEVVKQIIIGLERKNKKVNEINLLINVDGLPLSKSSKSSFWPILCSDTELKNVFVVGIYHGYGKPNNANEFLEEFVAEAKHYALNGITHNNQFYNINFHGLICDTPAKAFVLKIKGHGGYSSFR